MYGLIGKIVAVVGKRDELVDILMQGVVGMPGCLSYVVAVDPEDDDLIWVTEVWESPEAHAASLSIPSVRDAIARGRPMIDSMEQPIVTTPMGGHGLVADSD